MSECNSITMKDPQILIDIQGCPDLFVEVEKQVLQIDFPAQVVINQQGGGTPSGDSEQVICQFEAGANIQVNRVVSMQPDGRIVHADKDDDTLSLDVIGMSRQSGATGQQVEVVKFGKLEGASFGTVSENYFLGNNGQITDTVPTTGNWLSVGMQQATNEFFVNIGETIRRN